MGAFLGAFQKPLLIILLFNRNLVVDIESSSGTIGRFDTPANPTPR